MAKQPRILVTLQDVQRRVDNLPTLPEITSFVMNLLEDPDSSAQDVSNVIVRDPSLSAQIMKLVNSAYFGLPQKIADLNRAIALLGYGRIKNLVLSLSLIRVFRAISKKQREDFTQFWQHSAVVAGLMKRVALRLGLEDPEQAFLTGLLHDVGKIAILGYFPKEYAAVLKAAEDKKESFAEAEGVAFSTGHAAVGAWMAKTWNLPGEVVDAIDSHHDDGAWDDDLLSAALYFADYAARSRGVACAGTFGATHFDERAWTRLGLPQEDYFEMMAAVDSEKAIAEVILQVTGVADASAD